MFTRCLLLTWPLLVFWGTLQIYKYLLLSQPLEYLDEKVRSHKAFVILTKPQNSLSLSTIRQIQPARIYLVHPPNERNSAEKMIRQLRTEKIYGVRLCEYDPFASKVQVRKSAMDCIEKIQREGESGSQVCFMATEDQQCVKKYDFIDGVLFNPYGAVGDGNPQPATGLLALAEYKLVGNAIFLQSLLANGLLKPRAHIIFSGSESARGLPKMGFPVPQLGHTRESIDGFLTGEAYRKSSSDHENSKMDSSSMASSYKWEHAYADLCAIGVLYMSKLGKMHPDFYFGTVSPGMTQEGLNPYNVPDPSLGWILRMTFYRYLMFPILKHLEIAQDVDNGAALFARALTGDNWEYPSGTFVGAASGTGGPIGNQASLFGGKMFLDEQMQDLSYEVVHKYLE